MNLERPKKFDDVYRYVYLESIYNICIFQFESNGFIRQKCALKRRSKVRTYKIFINIQMELPLK